MKTRYFLVPTMENIVKPVDTWKYTIKKVDDEQTLKNISEENNNRLFEITEEVYNEIMKRNKYIQNGFVTEEFREGIQEEE